VSSKEINSQSEKILKADSSRHMTESRESEIKRIGIIEHLKRAGERLKELYEKADMEEDEKNDLYRQYLDILNKDSEMIEEQKKVYDEELPENVASITRPIDENMVKVMKKCLSVIDNYIEFIEEKEHSDLISNSFEILIEASYLLDDTEDMLRVVLESVETKGGVIGEA
jgi:DNA-binding transcriptional MerR regulator